MVNSGYKQSLFWANETAFGDGTTADSAIGLVQSVNPTETNTLIKIRTLGGNRDYSNVVPGKFEVSGSFEYYLQDAKFIRQAWSEDTATTTTTDSGPKVHTGASYLHVMGSANSPTMTDFPSFSLEFVDDEDGGNPGTYNLKRLYSGCRANNMTISATVDEPLRISCDYMAQKVTISTAAAQSVSQSTDDPYVFYQGAVYATSGAITAYTVPDSDSMIAEVNGFDLSLNNNMEAKWYVSGTTDQYQTKRTCKFIVPKGREYDSSLNLDFADKGMYEKFLGAAAATGPQDTLTSYNVVIDFVKTGTIGSDPKLATDEWIRVVMKDCKFNDINIAGAPEDIVSQNIGVFPEKTIMYVVDDISSYAT